METTLLGTIATGAILGMVGQWIRYIVGIGKNDPAAPIVPGKLLQGTLIGAVAGILAVLFKAPKTLGMENRDLLLMIITAGYAGTDFIEGLFNTIKNKVNASPSTQTTQIQALQKVQLQAQQSKKLLGMDTYNAGKSNKIDLSFDLSGNDGFVPLFTLVFLQSPDGAKLDKPKFITPTDLSDASIPQTDKFDHMEGTLIFQTYLSYDVLSALGMDEVNKRMAELIFDYSIDGGTDGNKSYSKYDSNPVFIETSKTVFFSKSIDIL